MADGLSTESAVTGFAKGFSLGNAAIDAKQNRELRAQAAERENKLFAMKEEEYDANKKAVEREELEAEFSRDLRYLYESGGEFDRGMIEKYQSLLPKKYFDPKRRQEMKQAGGVFKEALDTGNLENPALLGAGDVLLADQLAAREAKDGLKRRVAAARRTKDGRVALELELIGKDGQPYRAPMTKDGSSNKDDEIILIDDAKFGEMANAAMYQGGVSNMLDKAGGDPKAIADSLYYAYFGSRLSPQAGQDGFEYKKGYDKNGQEVLYQFDNKTGKSTIVGGAKAVDPKDQKQNQIDTKPLFEALNEIDTSTDFMTEEERQRARDSLNQNTVALYGATLDEIIHAQNVKAQNGDYSPLTRPQLMEMKSAWNKYQADADKRNQEQMQAQQEQLSSAQQNAVSLADSALEGSPLGAKAPPMPELKVSDTAPPGLTRRMRRNGDAPQETAEAIEEQAASEDREDLLAGQRRSQIRKRRKAEAEQNRSYEKIASLREAAQKADSPQEVNAIAQQIVSLSDASASLDSF